MKDWVKEDSASHRQVREMQEQQMEELNKLTVLDMLEADIINQDLFPQSRGLSRQFFGQISAQNLSTIPYV